MSAVSPTIQGIARLLLARESAASNPPEPSSRPVMLVCEKLRIPLSTLAGAEGYRSLISRALILARKDAPSLGTAQVSEDGGLDWRHDTLSGPEPEEFAEDGTALVAQLLGLLVTFIGEALTLNIVHDIWPDLNLEDNDSETEKQP